MNLRICNRKPCQRPAQNATDRGGCCRHAHRTGQGRQPIGDPFRPVFQRGKNTPRDRQQILGGFRQFHALAVAKKQFGFHHTFQLGYLLRYSRLCHVCGFGSAPHAAKLRQFDQKLHVPELGLHRKSVEQHLGTWSWHIITISYLRMRNVIMSLLRRMLSIK